MTRCTTAAVGNRNEGRRISERGSRIRQIFEVTASHRCLATGSSMIRVAEAALQVMGKAGAHQVPNVKTALATGYGGNAWTDAMILSANAS